MIRTTFKHFTIDEFDCKETGENRMEVGFVIALDMLRETCGFPFVITSGYRSPSHSKEMHKSKPGMHSEGIASDIAATDGVRRRQIVEQAMLLGFTGIGVGKNFVHVDTREGQPIMWGY